MINWQECLGIDTTFYKIKEIHKICYFSFAFGLILKENKVNMASISHM